MQSHFLVDNTAGIHDLCKSMKKALTGITKRLVAGILVAVAVVGVSAFTIHTPSQNSAARSLNSIQTDKATLFYASFHPDALIFVEQVLPGTSESKAATENLKLVAAAL
jgi:site-specific recombinase